MGKRFKIVYPITFDLAFGRPDVVREPEIKNIFKKGEVVELVRHITIGYSKHGSEIPLVPVPTLVKILSYDGLGYRFKILREHELPSTIHGIPFKEFIGDRINNFKVIEKASSRLLNKEYWALESYFRNIKATY